jgi:superfamily II DNA or RNA helicase
VARRRRLPVRVKVYPSRIVLEDGPATDYIEKRMSVWDSIRFCVKARACRGSFDSGDLVLPGGTDFMAFRDCRGAESIEDLTSSGAWSFRKASWKMSNVPQNKEQEDAIDFLVGKTGKQHTQRLLCLATGRGKTYCAIAAAHRLGRAWMVLYDQTELGRQWRDQILLHTDLTKKDILVVDSTEKVRELSRAGEGTHKVYLVSHRTLTAHAGSQGPDGVARFIRATGVGLKVHDEAHVEFDSTVSIDCCSDVALSWYLTATPGRSDHLEDSLWKKAFATVPQQGFVEKFDEDKKYHKVVYVSLDSKPSYTVEQSMSASKRGFDGAGWTSWMQTGARFEYLAETFLSQTLDGLYAAKPGLRVAITVRTNSMVDALQSYMSARFPSKTVATYNGLVGKKDKAMALKADIIVTTDSSFGKAMDVPGLGALFQCVPSSSPVVAEQMLGRLRGGEGVGALYFDVTDEGFSACKRQRTSRKPVLEAKAKKTGKMIVPME